MRWDMRQWASDEVLKIFVRLFWSALFCFDFKRETQLDQVSPLER